MLTLAELFDMADDNGDNFLTSQEFSGLLASVDGIKSILDQLGWLDESKDPTPVVNAIIQEIRTRYRNAVDLDQFVLLMSRFMP